MFRYILLALVCVVTCSAVDLIDDVTSDLFNDLNGFDDHDDHMYNFHPLGTQVPVKVGGSVHIASLPDLVNLVFGLGGHIVGRAGWIVHDAIKSLGDGLINSRYKLTDYDYDDFDYRYRPSRYYMPTSIKSHHPTGFGGIADPKVFGGLPNSDFGNLKF